MTVTCHADYRVAVSSHKPVAEEKCYFCHAQVVQEHPVDGVQSFELVDTGAKLCFLCHKSTDFSMMFQHGPVAVGDCNRCHNPHVSSYQTLLKKPIRDLCLECHDDFSSQMSTAAYIHPPVKKAPCIDCHNPHSSPLRFNLKQKMPDLCFSCHPQVRTRAEQAKVKHQPLNQNGNCGMCHTSHFSDQHALLRLSEQRLCLNCHSADSQLQNIAEQLSENKQLHGPLKEGRCADCHDPHGSDFFRLLRGNYPSERYQAYQEGAYGFCLRCHNKNLLRFEETTIYTNFRNGNKNLHFVHVADIRKGRSCRLCHEPHSSEGMRLVSNTGASFGNWKMPIGLEVTETGGKCAPGCHQQVSYDRENQQINDFKAIEN